MPRYRKLHVKTLESFDVNDMPDDFTRLTWILLPLILCREGRGVFDDSWLRSKLYPLRDDVTREDITNTFDYFVQRDMIIPYQVGSRWYFWVPSFAHYQGDTSKEGESDYPAPPDLLQSNSGPTPEQVESRSASTSDATSDVDSHANASTTAKASDVAAGHALLVRFGVEEPAATQCAACPLADIEGWIAAAQGKKRLDNPPGYVVSKLQAGIPPPPAPSRRRFIEGQYADCIEH